MSSPESAPFKTYKQATSELHALLDKHGQSREDLRFDWFLSMSKGGSISLVDLIKSQDRAHARAVLAWRDRTTPLGFPWPDDQIDALFTPSPDLQKRIASSQGNPAEARRIPRRSLPCTWIGISDPPLQRKLLRLPVEEIGVSPTRYFPHPNITLLGMSAYSINASAVKIMLKNCSPPASRLVTLPEHLKKVTADHWLVESTLLHRVAQQLASLSAQSQDPDEQGRWSGAIATMDLMIRHDPGALMARNRAGHLPEEMAPLSDVGAWLEARRQHIQSKARHTSLSRLAGDKRSPPRPASTPRI